MSSDPSNFAFLQPDWPDLLAEARRAEAAAHADPRTACFYARRTSAWPRAQTSRMQIKPLANAIK